MTELPQDELDFSIEFRKEAFRKAAISISQILLGELINVTPFWDPDLLYFSKLTVQEQELLIKSFNAQIELLQAMPKQGLSFLSSNRILVLSFLNKMGLGHAEDLLDYLSDSDFVAAYNDRLQIIFLSPNHLIWMTYSLEEIHCRPWYELFSRDPVITQKLIERGMDFALGKRTTTMLSDDIPPHTVSEISGPESAKAISYSKFYSPLFKEGKASGFLVSNEDRFNFERRQRQKLKDQ